MRLIAKSTLVDFYKVHPETKSAIERWHSLMKNGTWKTAAEVQAAFSSAVVLNGERLRFEIAGGNYRLDLPPNLSSFIRRVCSSFSPVGGVLRTRSV